MRFLTRGLNRGCIVVRAGTWGARDRSDSTRRCGSLGFQTQFQERARSKIDLLLQGPRSESSLDEVVARLNVEDVQGGSFVVYGDGGRAVDEHRARPVPLKRDVTSLLN